MASHQQQQQRISPRKFSEKIALLNQKEQEGTKAFQQIIKEVEETRTRNPFVVHQNDQGQHYLSTQQSSHIDQSLTSIDQCPTLHQNILYTTNQLNQVTNGSCDSFYNNMPAARVQDTTSIGAAAATLENNQQQYNQSDNPYSFNGDNITYASQNSVTFDNNYFTDQQLLGFDSFGRTTTDNINAADNNSFTTKNIIVDRTNQTTGEHGQQHPSTMVTRGDLDGHLVPPPTPSNKWRSNSDSAMSRSFASSLGTSPVDHTATFNYVATSSSSDKQQTDLVEPHDLPDLSSVYLQDESAVTPCDGYDQGGEQIDETTLLKNTSFGYLESDYTIGEEEAIPINDNCLGQEYTNTTTTLPCGSTNEDFSSLQHQQTYEPQCMSMESRDSQSSRQSYVRPKSCKVPGIEICTIEDEHVGSVNSAMQLSTSNTGSLPNLTNSTIFHSVPNEVSLGSKSSNVSSKDLVRGTRLLDSNFLANQSRSRTYYNNDNSEVNFATLNQPRHGQLTQIPITLTTQPAMVQNTAYDNRLEQPHQPLIRSSSMTSSSQNSCFAPNENFLCKNGSYKLNNNYTTLNNTNGSNTIMRSNSHNNLCYRYEQNQHQHHQEMHHMQLQEPIQQHQLDTRLHDNTNYISLSQDSFCDKTVNGVRYSSPISGSSVPSPSSDQGSPSSHYSKYSQQSPQSLTEVSRSNNISPVSTTWKSSSSYKDELWISPKQQIKQMTNNVNDQALNSTLSANSSQQPSSVGPCKSPTVFRRSQNHAAYKNIVPNSRNHSHHR